MSRTRPQHRPADHTQLLLSQLEREHANATAQRWDQVLADVRADVGGRYTAHDLATLERELRRLRDRALSTRLLRHARHALVDGAFTIRRSDDGWERWELALPDGDAVTVYAPVEDDHDPAAVIARCALRRGSCPACHSTLAATGPRHVTIGHKRRCPAYLLTPLPH